jgi:hypothetical protein
MEIEIYANPSQTILNCEQKCSADRGFLCDGVGGGGVRKKSAERDESFQCKS